MIYGKWYLNNKKWWTPFFENKDTGYCSWRANIWKSTDPRRTGIPKFVFKLNFFWIKLCFICASFKSLSFVIEIIFLLIRLCSIKFDKKKSA